jgi:hypothetical protein
MKGKASKVGVLLCLAALTGLPAASAAALTEAEPRGSVLELVDGSTLHGQLEHMDPEHGLSWIYPEAREPIHFQPACLDSIRFAHADNVVLSPTCHLRFANGDELYGSISSLDDGRLGFSTWFGGAMSIPRAAVRAITFLARNYRIIYEGPYDAGGWIIGNTSLQTWTYRDGCFIGAGSGTLARELSLTNSSTIEFDLAWTGPFDLRVDPYCTALDHVEYNRGSYVVEFSPKQITLRHLHPLGPANVFASVALPGGGDKGKIHAVIQCNKDEGTLSVFVNDLLVKSWKDDAGFNGGGTGLLFQEDATVGVAVKLSNFRIAQWEGRYEPDTSIAATNSDAVHFINHDRANGTITAIKDGKVTLALGATTLNVPLERVTQINFAGAIAPAPPSGPWQVRARFPGGGSLSFQLQQWDDRSISGKSAIFGPLAFQPGAIRQLEFNLNRSREDAATVGGKRFQDLDE